ncbi:MAG: glycosyltransferase N-terminal domain-containing protein [Terriglobales bacterium]
MESIAVGEVVAASAVVEALRQQFPAHRVVISTTTSTGQKLAAKRFCAENVFFFPLDFAFAVRPYVDALRPELCVIVETEFWPNFLRLAKSAGARIAVINCRISDRSLPGYRRLRFWLPRVLEPVDLFLAQTDEDARRLVEIGAAEEKVRVSGNLKFDVAPPAAPAIVASLRSVFDPSNTKSNATERAGAGPVLAWPILVCGSTLEGEEATLLSAFRNILATYPKAVMLLAPRHPERFAEVATLVEQLGFRMEQRSLWSGESLAGGVLLLDSIGELAALYAVATIAFVGGSLVPRGGHNILEPALYGVPIVTGNHYENFLELIENDGERATLGRNALAALESQRGATARTVSSLVELMDRRAPLIPRGEAGE